MKVDMSPAAVSGRLSTMGDLWELSIKLMRSEVAGGKSSKTSGAFAIQESIRQVLLERWDPIGIAEFTGCRDEYDSYIAPLYRILVGSRLENDLIESLRRIEKEEFGVGPSDARLLRPVAVELLQLKVSLN